MTRPRSELVSLDTTPYYHCISRCVRRAFLLGSDDSGRNFDHRKKWLVARIKYLGEIFAVDIAAYVVMSNHYHLVLHIDKAKADAWSDDEICRRWGRLYRGPAILRKYLEELVLTTAERSELKRLVRLWREQLCNLSRFMACLNHVIALRANKEDGCTGRFWEGRFKSQALKDEAALLACMAYVDLNPVRAGMTDDPISSDFTSIQDRIKRKAGIRSSDTVPRLMPFSNPVSRRDSSAYIPFTYQDYVQLVRWYGRRRQGNGKVVEEAPVLLKKVRLTVRQWELLSREIQKESSTLLDGLEKIAVLERRLRHVA